MTKVTREEAEKRYRADMARLLYHAGALHKHTEFAIEIAKQYRIMTATGMTAWRAKYSEKVLEYTQKSVRTIESFDSLTEDPINDYWKERFRRKRERMIKVASRLIREERKYNG